jgi:hypothetical protein
MVTTEALTSGREHKQFWRHSSSAMKDGLAPTEAMIRLAQAATFLPKVDGKKVSVCTL